MSPVNPPIDHALTIRGKEIFGAFKIAKHHRKAPACTKIAIDVEKTIIRKSNQCDININQGSLPCRSTNKISPSKIKK
jgi:hypothetical protein